MANFYFFAPYLVELIPKMKAKGRCEALNGFSLESVGTELI